MAEAFNGYNFNQVVNNSLKYLKKEYTAAAIAKEEMEKQEIEKAKAAIQETGTFGNLTLGQRLGFGKRAAQQIVDTAAKAVGQVVSPLTEFLDKYEKVFDEEQYKVEFNGDAFQLYSAAKAMQEQASEGVRIVGLNNDNTIGIKTGTRFIMDM